MSKQDIKKTRDKIEELNWIMAQIREGLQKIKESKEEHEVK